MMMIVMYCDNDDDQPNNPHNTDNDINNHYQQKTKKKKQGRPSKTADAQSIIQTLRTFDMDTPFILFMKELYALPTQTLIRICHDHPSLVCRLMKIQVNSLSKKQKVYSNI